MDPLEEGEDENDDRELDENDTEPRKLGERCGTTNFCAQGLDCVRFPIRRKCMPVTCAIQAVKDTIFKTGFDLEGYGEFIMEKSGVSMNSDMFRQFPDAGLNIIDRQSEDVMRVQQAIADNPPPFKYFSASFSNCTGEQIEQTFGLTPYSGASWELGALGTYNGDIFWG